MSQNARRTFIEVKPLCIALSRKKDRLSAQVLQEYIKHVSSNAIQELHEYLLFPLRVVFLQELKIKEDVVIATAGCMHTIFQKTFVNEWKTFQDLYYVLILQITNSSNGNIEASGSEDKKFCILSAILSLFENSLHKHWLSFYDVNNISSIGHFVSLCLSIIKTEENKSLRKIAIDALHVLSNRPSFIEENQVLSRFLVGNCMACFLPGVLSVLIKVVSGDVKQGQAIKCKAIHTITVFLKVAAGDSELGLINDSSVKKYRSETTVSSDFTAFLIDRNKAWVNGVANKMNVILDHVTTACDHMNSNVRLSVLEFSREMLLSCHKNLFKAYIGALLKIPCKLLSDEIEELASKGLQVLNESSCFFQGNICMREVLQEELFDLCTRLPNIMAKSSDCEKLSYLRLMFGLLDVQKHSLNVFFLSSAHVDNLLKSLLHCFELECSNMLKIEVVSSSKTNYDQAITSFYKGQSSNWFFKKIFSHFHDEEISKILIKICRLLGKFGDLDILIDWLKERYISEKHCIAVVLILNEVLLGTWGDTKPLEHVYSVVEGLIELYVSDENWYLYTCLESLSMSTQHTKKIQNKFSSLSLNEKHISKLTIKALNSNITLSCLHLEAMAAFSVVLSFGFRKVLISSLYPLLEKVNDNNHLISSCAIKALTCISVSCKYNSIAELIIDNVDYLVSTISIHLKHLSLFPRSPAVLRAMLTHSDVSVFPLIQDTIDDILSALDIHRHNNQYLKTFLPVLMSAAEAIKNWYPKSKLVTKTNSDVDVAIHDKNEQNCCTQTLVHFLSDFYKNSKLANMDDELIAKVDDDSKLVNFHLNENILESDFFQNHSSPNISFDDKKNVHPHVKVIERIMQRCSHLLASSDPRVRLLVIDIIKEGIYSVCKEENILLPLVHKLWKPLTLRCNDPELQVVAKIFDIICCLGEHCGVFMRRRFTKDILPKLIAFLKDHSLPPKTPNKNLVYNHTMLFKLQVLLLNGIGPLMQNSTVSFKELHAICDACRYYLSSKHIIELQKAALVLFKHLIKIDPDSLWLFLSDTWSYTSTYKPDKKNSTIFNSVSVAGTSDQASEFSHNVQHLLSFC